MLSQVVVFVVYHRTVRIVYNYREEANLKIQNERSVRIMSTIRKDYEQTARETSSDAKEKPKVLEGLTPRVVIMLVLLTVFATWLNCGHYQQGTGTVPRVDALGLPNPVGFFALLVLSFISFKLKSVAKILRLDFSKAELLTIYICSGLAFLLSSAQFAMSLISAVATLPFRVSWFPTSHTHTETLSRWLFLWDDTIVENFMFGEGKFMLWPWMRTFLLWFVMFGAIFFLLYAIAALLYSRWSDVERLPFPLVTPVVKLAESMDGTAGREYSFKNPIFLIGLIIPFLISTTNILHEYIPVVPEVKTYFSVHEQITSGILGQSFAEWPGTLFIVHPYTVGIGYLVPTDFTFSIWFSFYVLQRMVLFPVLLSAGVPLGGDRYPEIMFRAGVLVYGIFLLWIARKSIMKFILAAFGKTETDPQEHPMSPKLLVFGSIASIIIIIWFGMALLSIQFHTMLFYLLTLITIAVVHARFRTEPGLPFVQMWTNSAGITLSLFGSDSGVISRASRVGLAYIDKYPVWSVPSTTAWVMEGLKMADETGMRRRSMMKALALVIVLVFAISFPMILKTYHNAGFSFGIGRTTANEVPGQTHTLPGYVEPAPYGVMFWLIGAGVTIFCAFMRLNFIWWPLHPWGFLLGNQLDTYYRFPGAFFVAWLIKVVILRWFGKQTYDKLKPLFIALIISDIAMMLVKLLVGVIYGLFV